ncbi:MAG: TonB-dependent receptor [Bacteroidota bacterium]
MRQKDYLKSYIFGWLILFSFHISRGNEIPRNTLSGYIYDAGNGEALIGATVLVKGEQTGTVTNLYGFYSLSLPPGIYEIQFSYIGYDPVEKYFNFDDDISYSVELQPSVEELEEVTISTERKDANVTRAEMSVQKLNMKEIKQIPAFMGEVDLIKAIQLLPGVQSTVEGGSGFSVRGGGADQNLILLDEATVYNASHLMGFFSVFNNDAIKDVKLYKGDIPAQYGGRLSSILDVRMNEGNTKEFTGTGGIGTISSRLTLEGPIIKDKTSFILSGRRTYADLFIPLAGREELEGNRLFFYDANLKLNHRFNDNNRVFVSGYFGRDVFKNDFARMGFGNKTFTLRWNNVINSRLFANYSFITSNYDYDLGTPAGQANGFTWLSSMKDHCVKADYNWFINPGNTLRFGGTTIYHYVEPGFAKGEGDSTAFGGIELPRNHALEHGVYINNELKVGEKLTLKYGLRYSAFQNVGSGKHYSYNDNFEVTDTLRYGSREFFHFEHGLEPRLGIIYLINEATSLKTSYSRTMQYMHLASNSTGSTPLDVWFPTSPNVKPQLSDQFAVGLFRNFLDNRLETSVEVYYKDMRNVVDFKDHAELLLNEKLEGELRAGTARAYGAEFLVKLTEGKITGWTSYTFSRSERKIPAINEGAYYPAPYDKPHDVTIVLNYALNKRITFGANWLYSTGSPVTFPVQRAHIGGLIMPVYSKRNAYRLPDYHRLDLSFTIGSKKKEGKLWQGEWNFSVYNAYGRKNTWAINFEQDYQDPDITYAEKTYLFSVVPAITYNFKF